MRCRPSRFRKNRLKGIDGLKGKDGLKGQQRLAQGNALGMDYQRICALKGQKRNKTSHAFALSGRILASPFTQGVALG